MTICQLKCGLFPSDKTVYGAIVQLADIQIINNPVRYYSVFHSPVIVDVGGEEGHGWIYSNCPLFSFILSYYVLEMK